MLQAIEFKSKSAYDSWLRKMGKKIRIVNVSTTKRWSLWKGFIGDSKTYTVTYELLQASTESRGSVISPGGARFMAACIVAMLADISLNGSAIFAGIIASFVVICFVPILKVARSKKLVIACAIVTVVIAIQIYSVVAAHKKEAVARFAAQESAQEAANKQAVSKRTFELMSSAEHLVQVKKLLQPDAPESVLEEADKHIQAIPASSPEAHAAAAIRAKFMAESEKKAAEFAKQTAKENAATAEAARVAFAKTVETQMLDEGWDFDVTAIGSTHTILRMKWVLADNVAAHQISNQNAIFDTARQLGFKKMELTDGYDKTWTWTLR